MAGHSDPPRGVSMFVRLHELLGGPGTGGVLLATLSTSRRQTSAEPSALRRGLAVRPWLFSSW